MFWCVCYYFTIVETFSFNRMLSSKSPVEKSILRSIGISKSEITVKIEVVSLAKWMGIFKNILNERGRPPSRVPYCLALWWDPVCFKLFSLSVISWNINYTRERSEAICISMFCSWLSYIWIFMTYNKWKKFLTYWNFYYKPNLW